MSIIQQTIGWLALFLFGGLVGALATSFFISIETVIETVVTEKIVTVEIEKPIITEKIVEVDVIKEVEVYRFIDEENPVHKWVDPDNQAVVYIFPEGYTGEIWPMYYLVPPAWFNQILQVILDMNEGVMPPEVFNSIPKEWQEAVAPGTTYRIKTNDLN